MALTPTEGCELTRVALDKHIAPVSKIVAIAIKILKKTNPGMKLIVSFADSRQNHKGGIYQAMNWIFTGSVKTTDDIFYKGRWMHQRTVHSLRGTIKGLEEKRDGGLRHRYLYVLDESIRKQIQALSKPYPKHASVV